MRNDTSLAWMARRWHGCARLALPEALPQRTPVGPGEGQLALEREAALQAGAMPQAICAASMAMVPEPQQGQQRAARFGRAAPAGGGEHRGGQRLPAAIAPCLRASRA